MIRGDVIGLVPAAGRGVRLSLPYPKELYPIIRENRYKPVAQFVLENLVASGVKQMVFVINETKHQLIGYFGDGHRFGIEIGYAVQEPVYENGSSTSPGLAHALDSAYHLIRGKTVFFGMADTIMQPQDVFCRAYEKMQDDDDVVLGLFPTTHPEKFGMVQLNQEQCVVRIVDKPRVTELTEMWGCIIWKPRFTEHLHFCLNKQGLRDFAEIMNRGISAGLKFRGVRMTSATYIDLGTYEEIMELDERFRR